MEQEVIEYAFNYVIGKNRLDETYLKNQCENDVYGKYVEYVEKYFNTFLDKSEYILKCNDIYTQNLFTIISFRVESSIEDKTSTHEQLLKEIVDVLGVASIENIKSEMIIKNRLSGFLDNGFFVIKEKEIKNWTLMSAIKDVEYFSKIILQENEEDTYEEEK